MVTAKRLNKEWAEALRSVSSLEPDMVPDDWKTIKTIMAEQGISSTRTKSKIAMLCERGMCEMKKFRIQRGPCVAKVAHYRLKHRI